MIRRILMVLAALMLSLSITLNAAQSKDSSFAQFKQEFMPQIGKTITVDGVLQSAKLGWFVAFNGWGIYIYSANSKHVAASNSLDRFGEKMVRVTAPLHYSPKPEVPAGDVAVALPPEHFYFDVAEAKVVQQEATIKELARKPLVVSTAPLECLATFRQFFSYVQQDKPSIVADDPAQQRWLTKSLRDALKQKVATFKDQPDDPDFPGNSAFVGSWDKPSTFTIIGSRRYDKRAVIDVWYTWGKGTNYPGDTRLSYFVFLLEDGRWKLDDIYTFRGEFAMAESLTAYLRTK